jgi:phenylpyruvate tautomerase PptA (4-oxalocrotonate tautomerase family)
MPVVNVQLVKGILGEGKTAAAKKAEISRRFVGALSEAAGSPGEKVWIVHEDVLPAEWYVGSRSVEQNWREGR